MLPRIKINFFEGQLGTVGVSPDGLVSLIIGAMAVSSTFELGKSYSITKPSDLKELGITKENNPALAEAVTDFYKEAEEGTSVVVVGVDASKKMAELCANEDGAVVRSVIERHSGALRAVFVSTPAGDSEQATEGLSPDTLATLQPAQDLAEWATTSLYAPLFIVVDGRGYTGENLKDLGQTKFNRVGVLVGSKTAEDKGSCIGVLAGRIASKPVHRNVGRVADGALKGEAFYLGVKRIEEKQSAVTALYEKRYIAIRRYVGRTGYFFADDNLATALTDDYAQIANRRVIDKAYRIAYNTLLDKMLDEIELNEDGTMQAPILKSWESELEAEINKAMTANSELSSSEGSGCKVFIDPKQNVVSTSKIAISLKVRPHGYARYIDVNLGFQVTNSKTEG